MAGAVLKLLPTPTAGYPDTELRVTLEGASYRVRWRWNERDSAWTFSAWDADGLPLVLGVRVVVGADLLSGADISRRPPGVLIVTDPSGQNYEPALYDLGARVKVVFYSFRELTAA